MGLPRRTVNYGYLVLAIVLVLLTAGLAALVVFVVIPWYNRDRLDTARKRAKGAPPAPRIRVVLVCTGDLRETFEQVGALYNHAWTPDAVYVTVVLYTQCPVKQYIMNSDENTKALEFRTRQLSAVRPLIGVADKDHLALEDKVTVVDVSRAPEGPWAALQEAVTPQLTGELIAMFDMGVTPAPEWDRTLVRTLQAVADVPSLRDAAAAGPTMVSQDACPGTTPCIAQTFYPSRDAGMTHACSAIPTFMWKSLKRNPTTPIRQTLLSSSFVAAPADHMRKWLSVVASSGVPTRFMPPFGAFVLTNCLIEAGGVLLAPLQNVVTPSASHSSNLLLYHQTLEQHAASRAFHLECGRALFGALSGITGTRMGVDWDRHASTPHGLLGVGVQTCAPYTVDVTGTGWIEELDTRWGSAQAAMEYLARCTRGVLLTADFVDATHRMFGLVPGTA